MWPKQEEQRQEKCKNSLEEEALPRLAFPRRIHRQEHQEGVYFGDLFRWLNC